MSRNAKLVVIIGVLMFSTVLVVAMIVANIRYNAGYESGYSLAYSTRYSEGYDKGFSVGNLTGYQIGNSSGYNLGFSEGNMSGYESGYDVAYDIAYDEGYLQGSSEGNATGYEQGYDDGYTQGLEDGAGHGYTIRNPTYQEALQFINDDRTNENYWSETYTCFNFAADFEANAFKAGYRCGFVYVEWVDGGHAMVCFDTVDHGLIYIEPQDDNIVSLKVGGLYWGDEVIYIAIVW